MPLIQLIKNDSILELAAISGKIAAIENRRYYCATKEAKKLFEEYWSDESIILTVEYNGWLWTAVDQNFEPGYPVGIGKTADNAITDYLATAERFYNKRISYVVKEIH